MSRPSLVEGQIVRVVELRRLAAIVPPRTVDLRATDHLLLIAFDVEDLLQELEILGDQGVSDLSILGPVPVDHCHVVLKL